MRQYIVRAVVTTTRDTNTIFYGPFSYLQDAVDCQVTCERPNDQFTCEAYIIELTPYSAESFSLNV